MLSFLSDFHLLDDPLYPSYRTTRLFNRLNILLDSASHKRLPETTIVLLGDIFDCLRSRLWISMGVRPWEDPSLRHQEAVKAILEAIIATNGSFFQGFSNLLKTYQCARLVYIPGNHDRVLNTEMGKYARDVLLEKLPFQIKHGKQFPDLLIDVKHGVLAKHGHEWDPPNRYSHEAAAIGDAIVIDLLLRLPDLISLAIGISPTDSRLNFLHAIGDVYPQQPSVLAKWLLVGFDSLQKAFPKGRSAIKSSLRNLSADFKDLIESIRFEEQSYSEWWISFINLLLNLNAEHLFIKAANHLPKLITTYKPHHYLAREDAQLVSVSGVNCQYIVCGHTHTCEVVPFLTSKDSPRISLYINTGTWRTTYRITDIPLGNDSYAFHKHQDECIVTVYSPQDQDSGFPAYAIDRSISGGHFGT